MVNGKLGYETWVNIRTYAIPISPGGLNPFKRREAQQQLSGIREKYGQDATFLVIPDDETFEGWSARPVLAEDLTKEPDAVLQEAFDALGDDMFLADMKRNAYMAITGHIDTK